MAKPTPLFEPENSAAMAELRAILESESFEEVVKFCNGTIHAATMGQRIFRERWPDEYERWNAELQAS